MQLTKVTNVSGEVEYINVELITNVAIESSGGADYFHVEFAGKGSVAVALTDPAIAALRLAAN